MSKDETTPLNRDHQRSLDPQIKHGIRAFTVTGFAAIGAQPGVLRELAVDQELGRLGHFR